MRDFLNSWRRDKLETCFPSKRCQLESGGKLRNLNDLPQTHFEQIFHNLQVCEYNSQRYGPLAAEGWVCACPQSGVEMVAGRIGLQQLVNGISLLIGFCSGDSMDDHRPCTTMD